LTEAFAAGRANRRAFETLRLAAMFQGSPEFSEDRTQTEPLRMRVRAQRKEPRCQEERKYAGAGSLPQDRRVELHGARGHPSCDNGARARRLVPPSMAGSEVMETRFSAAQGRKASTGDSKRGLGNERPNRELPTNRIKVQENGADPHGRTRPEPSPLAPITATAPGDHRAEAQNPALRSRPGPPSRPTFPSGACSRPGWQP
jgi:hypothetical protein